MVKKYKVLLTREARNDLAEIYDYISSDNPENAAAFVLAVEEKVESLVLLPERASMIPENTLLGTGYRHLVHGSYRIIFRIQGEDVIVLRVIHGARILHS